MKIEDVTLIVEKFCDRSESGENSSYIEDIIVLLGEMIDKEADFNEKLVEKLILILVQYNSEKVSNSVIKVLSLITQLKEKLENSVNKLVGNVCLENRMNDFKNFQNNAVKEAHNEIKNSKEMIDTAILEKLLTSIWIKVDEVFKFILLRNSQPYFTAKVDENGKINKDIIKPSPIHTSAEGFVKKTTEKHLRKLIRDYDNLIEEDKRIAYDYPEIVIPENYRDFVCKRQLVKWINSAISIRNEAKEETFELILKKLFEMISIDKINEVLIFAQKFKSKNNTIIIKFLSKVLFENGNKELRNKAYEFLKSVEFDEIKDIIQIENKIQTNPDNIQDILQDCLKLVQNKKKLSLNCLELMSKSITDSSLIIKIIIKNNIQEIPSFFIDEFKKMIAPSQTKETESFLWTYSVGLFKSKQIDETKLKKLLCLLDVCKSLMLGSYIFLDASITNICKMNEKLKYVLMEMVEIELNNNRKLSSDIIVFVKQEALKSEYAANILSLIEKKEHQTDIVKNPRISLEERKKALKEILTKSISNLPLYIKTLQDLIKGDHELGKLALEGLIQILPNDYSNNESINKVLNFDIISNSKDLEISHVETLFKKDKRTDFSNFNEIIFSRINDADSDDTIKNLIKLLENISKSNSGFKFVKENLKNFFELSINFTDNDNRNLILQIIKYHKIDENEIGKYIDLNIWKSMLKMDTLHEYSEDLMNSLLATLNQKVWVITQDKIDHLINALTDNKAKKPDDMKKITDTLLKINSRQTLNETSIDKILAAIGKLKSLLDFPSVSVLLMGFLNKGIKISDDVKESTMEKYIDKKDDFMDIYSILTLRSLALKGEKLNESVIKKLLSNFKNIENRIELRTICGQILQTQSVINDNEFIRVFEDVALKTACMIEAKHLVLNSIAFKGLKNRRTNLKFLKNYYSEFKKRFGENTIGFQKLDSFLNENTDAKQIYELILILNEIYFKRKTIYFSVFKDFNPKYWMKEILCNELIIQIYEIQSKENGVDQFQLEDFKKQLDLIEDEQSLSLQRILEGLIYQQSLYDYNIKEVVVILKLLRSNNKLFDFLENENFDYLFRKNLIEMKLKDKNIEFTDEDVVKLYDYLQFRIDLLDEILENISGENSIVSIIKFSRKLDSSEFNYQMIENFFQKIFQMNSNVDEWIKKLDYFIIGEFLIKMYKEYDFSNQLNGNKKLYKLHRKLWILTFNGWSMQTIKQLINIPNFLNEMIDSLDILIEFDLREYETNIKNKSILNIFEKESPSKWVKKLNELALYRTFSGSFDKDLNLLIKEINELNGSNNTTSIFQNSKLLNEFKKVNEAYLARSEVYTVLSNEKTINNWTDDDIKAWSMEVRKQDSKISIAEKVAVIKNAVFLSSGHSPRDIQILSVLILLNPESNYGRLAQINTGEGKTIIVAMLAAIKALDGHQVDIVTSSPELARPQSQQQEKFFKLFQLTVSHNGQNDPVNIKERYKSNIVYGAVGDFQGDILRDEYSKMGTRNGRKCDIAIVDEVDSMLIDGKNHIVMISSPMPSMDHLEPLLASIWIQIDLVTKSIVELNGNAYFSVAESAFDEKSGDIKKEMIDQLCLIEGTKESFVKQATEKHIRKLIRDYDNLEGDDKNIPSEYPEIIIPKHLRDFICKCQLVKWIDSAINARYRFNLSQHYIIKDAKIAPVDANNTGVVQSNMHWSNGLHQFLQLKHGCKITAESLTTNFISNVTYFKYV